MVRGKRRTRRSGSRKKESDPSRCRDVRRSGRRRRFLLLQQHDDRQEAGDDEEETHQHQRLALVHPDRRSQGEGERQTLGGMGVMFVTRSEAVVRCPGVRIVDTEALEQNNNNKDFSESKNEYLSRSLSYM